MSKVKYISIERAKQLEEHISFLSNLTINHQKDENAIYVVGDSIEQKDWDIPKTQLLQQLIYHNQCRKDILEEFLK